MNDDLTLGAIHEDLQALVARGAHPGSIDWVLHHQLDWPGGDTVKKEDCRVNHYGFGGYIPASVARLPQQIRRPEPESPARWKLALLIALAVVLYTTVLVFTASRAGAETPDRTITWSPVTCGETHCVQYRSITEMDPSPVITTQRRTRLLLRSSLLSCLVRTSWSHWKTVSTVTV